MKPNRSREAPVPVKDEMPRRRLARRLLQCLALGMGAAQAQASPAPQDRTTAWRQWLPGQSLQAEDADSLEWLRCGSQGLELRVRSFRTLALWIGADAATPAMHAPRQLHQLQWRCTLQAGLRWRALTVLDDAVAKVRIEAAQLGSQRLSWPDGLLIQHALVLRWELQADAQERCLSWRDIHLDWR